MKLKEGDIVVWKSRAVQIECQVLYVEDNRALITPLAYNEHAEKNWSFLHASARQISIVDYAEKVYPYKHQRGGFSSCEHLTLAPPQYSLNQLTEKLKNEIQ